LRRPPLEIGSEETVRAAAVELASGIEQADERGAELPAHAAVCRDRGEVLLGEARALDTGDDDAAATAVLADERQVLPLLRSAGEPGSPLGRSEAARVDGVDRRRQQIDALQEKRALLREEEREALVGGDVRDVGLDLREVGVDRDVEDGVGVRKP